MPVHRQRTFFHLTDNKRQGIVSRNSYTSRGIVRRVPLVKLQAAHLRAVAERQKPQFICTASARLTILLRTQRPYSNRAHKATPYAGDSIA